jgi:hypothetical protein
VTSIGWGRLVENGRSQPRLEKKPLRKSKSGQGLLISGSQVRVLVKEANTLYNSLSPELRTNVHQGYTTILKNPKYSDWPKSIKHLPPKWL